MKTLLVMLMLSWVPSPSQADVATDTQRIMTLVAERCDTTKQIGSVSTRIHNTGYLLVECTPKGPENQFMRLRLLFKIPGGTLEAEQFITTE